jgi:hypothetical protein
VVPDRDQHIVPFANLGGDVINAEAVQGVRDKLLWSMEYMVERPRGRD